MADRFWVTCPEYTSGPYATEVSAQRKVIENDASARCNHGHHVVKSAYKPVPEWQQRLDSE